jgi:fatty-acyl-CoA synthase
MPGERHRHDGALADDAGRSIPLDAADVSREWLDVHLDRHGRRRDPLCLRKADAPSIYEQVNAENINMLCAGTDRLDQHCERPVRARKSLRRGVRVLTAVRHRPPRRSSAWKANSRWNLTQVYGLTETAPFNFDLRIAAGTRGAAPAERATLRHGRAWNSSPLANLRVVDKDMEDVPCDGASVGEIVARGNVVMLGYTRIPPRQARAFRGRAGSIRATPRCSS